MSSLQRLFELLNDNCMQVNDVLPEHYSVYIIKKKPSLNISKAYILSFAGLDFLQRKPSLQNLLESEHFRKVGNKRSI